MTDFAIKLRKCLDDRLRLGMQGIDLNQGKRGMPANLIHRNYAMSDAVFNLACTLAQTHELSPYSWVNWMTDAELTVQWDAVKVFHRNAFFCGGASERFAPMIAAHYNLPVSFIPDRHIEERVA